MEETEELAEVFYKAWNRYRVLKHDIAGPQWFALDENIKTHWRRIALYQLQEQEFVND